MDNTHQMFESKVADKAVNASHLEHAPVTQQAFNRRNSTDSNATTSRRASLQKNFEHANIATVPADFTHVEVSDDVRGSGDSIDDISPSWFVWLVALTASIAGALFGYDTGIISAVLVYLGNDLDHRPASSSEKEVSHTASLWLTI
jgi:MFS transporter, SP family, solute carrier family 2 (myo-inositol transporter), member 13